MAPAYADADDTFNITAEERLRAESNLFRAPTPRSERILSSSVQMALDKSYSLQRFELNATYLKQDYQTFDYLSYGALNYDAAWHWSITPKFHGTFGSTREQVLNDFADVQNPNARNLRTTQNAHLEGELEISRAMRLLGRVSEARSTNDLPVAQNGDNTLSSAAIGLRYVTPAGSSLSYVMRQGQGDYFNRVPTALSLAPTGFDEQGHEIQLVWPFTAKTDLNARIAHVQRSHSALAQRDYSGTVGNIGLRWNATGKISLALVVSRDLNSYQTNAANFTTLTRFTIAPTWRTSDKTSVRLALRTYTQNFGGAPVATVAPLDRHDNTRDIALSLNWQPARTVSLDLSLQNLRRSSSAVGFGYKSNIATVGARVNF